MDRHRRQGTQLRVKGGAQKLRKGASLGERKRDRERHKHRVSEKERARAKQWGDTKPKKSGDAGVDALGWRQLLSLRH